MVLAGGVQTRPERWRALRSCGKSTIHSTATAIVPIAADDHRRDDADQRGDRAGAELAKLVGGADEDHVDGVDAAAHRIGRPQLDQRLADIDADHVGGAGERQRGDRQPDDGREAEDEGEDAEESDAGEHDQPGMVAHRADGEKERHDERADAGRGAQEAEPPRPDDEDVAGVGRQQRRRTAEQNGEEIERDRAEDDLLVPDIAEAGDDGATRSPAPERSSAAASG